jgi:DNA-binding beta-propeller fold protein YncE
MAIPDRCITFAMAFLSFGVACSPTVAAPALPGSKAGGVFVLDNCDPDYQGKAAYADNLSFIDGAGKLVFRVSGFNTCEMIGSNRQIAYDAARGHVWVAECVGQQIRKLDLDGKELLVVKDIKPGVIALDPATGNLWAMRSTGQIDGGDLAVLSPAGKELAIHKVTGWDIAYDPKGKAFWLAGKDLIKVSLEGKLLVRKNVSTWCSSCLAVHPDTGRVWVAARDHRDVAGSRNEVLAFDNDGELKHTIPFGERDPFHLTIDKKTGSVWVTDFKAGIRRYSVDGKLEVDRKVEALAAHADPATGELWVVTPEETLRMSETGAIIKRVKHAGRTSQAWVAGP